MLSLGLPGAAVEVNRKMCNDVSSGGYDLKGPVLSPRSIGRVLAPAAASLEQMDIVADNVYLPAQHDGSRIDLSAFDRLRHLEVSACLLFGAGRGPVVSSGDDIWPCLPPALVKLTIAFDGDLGLFWSLAEMREHTRTGTFESQLWDRRLRKDGDGLRWLAELLRRVINGELGKQMRSIAVEEREVVDRDRNWALATWREPGGDRMQDLARAAAVDLEVLLRVPRSFRSEEFDNIEEAEFYGKPGTVSYNEEGQGPSNTASPASEAGMDDDW
ncbi:RNI-like protein [Apiospora hydei]|uniref:RNI-like protein n=1 Tax=Apiospora hydei TaxID=1337664 RepID=A0ABR1WYY1_9PEZI